MVPIQKRHVIPMYSTMSRENLFEAEAIYKVDLMKSLIDYSETPDVFVIENSKEVEKLILLQDGNACVKQDMPIPSKYGVYEMPPPYVVPDEHKTVSIYDCENWLEVLEKEEER